MSDKGKPGVTHCPHWPCCDSQSVCLGRVRRGDLGVTVAEVIRAQVSEKTDSHKESQVKQIESVNTIKEYADSYEGEKRKLVVTPHGIYSDRVVLEIEGVKFIALVDDLRKALMNAVNAHRF